jgi:hypothetical protein
MADDQPSAAVRMHPKRRGGRRRGGDRKRGIATIGVIQMPPQQERTRARRTTRALVGSMAWHPREAGAYGPPAAATGRLLAERAVALPDLASGAFARSAAGANTRRRRSTRPAGCRCSWRTPALRAHVHSAPPRALRTRPGAAAGFRRSGPPPLRRSSPGCAPAASELHMPPASATIRRTLARRSVAVGRSPDTAVSVDPQRRGCH